MRILIRHFTLLSLIFLLSKSSEAQCSLSLNDVTVCNGSPAVLGIGMQFTILSVPSNSIINSFEWTGPSGYVSSEQYPIINNPQAGTYTLTVQAPGCFTNVSASLTLSLTNVNCPIAAFTSSPTVVCSSSSVSFTNQSNPLGSTFFWLFGNGSTSSVTNPNHVFTAPQGTGITNYTVSLVVINASGVMSVEQNIVQVQQIPGPPEIISNQLQLFNGQEYLVRCTDNPTGPIFINGLSNNLGIWVQNITINWGDGSPLLNLTSFSSTQSHNYTPGLYTFTISVNGPNNCSISNSYPVFVGNTPAVNIGSPGNPEQCSPFTFNFPITDVENNVVGTTYTVTFSDGGPAQTFNHPPPAFFTHTFTQSSCGETTPLNFPDAFWVQIIAQNPCDIGIGQFQPIRISTPPTASFTAQPDPVCVNTLLTVNNTADPGTNVNSSGCNTNHGMVWSISPAIGWTLTSGTLGSVNGQPTNYTVWTNGSNQLELSFSIPGNYTITQRIRNSCGEDVATEVVCVVLPLTANFNFITPPCAPFVLSPNNLTNPTNGCVSPTYQWSISPVAPFNINIPPYTSSSFEPEWFLTENGDYTVTLSATNACGTSTATDSFTIVAPPEVNILPIPPGCNPYTVNAAVTYNDGGGTILTQQWQVNGGPWQTIVPSEPVNLPPQTFASGTHTIKVRITNECGIDSSEVSFTVTNPPIVTVPDFQACVGETVLINSGLPNAIGTPPLTYLWTGNGFNNTTIANPSITLNNVGIQTVTLTVTDALGCSSTNSVDISVNPLPILNALPNSMCIGDAPVPLSVSSNILGTSFSWSPSNGLNSTSGSSVFANPQVTTTYTISGLVLSTGCSASTNVELTVHPLPVVTTVPVVQVCAQPIPLELNQGTPSGGIWTDPTPLTGSITENSGVYFYTPANTAGSDTLLYTYINLNGCENTAILPILIVPVEEANAGLPQSLCLNSPSISLDSGTPQGGIWTGTGVISGFFNPAIAGVGTHSLVYTINQGTTCESSDTVIYFVLPIPLVDTGLPLEVCAGANADLAVNASGGTGLLSYSWSPINNIQSGQGTDQIQVSTNISFDQITTNYFVTVNDENNCFVNDSVTLIANPIPQVNAGPDSVLCNQPINYPLNGFPVSGSNGIGIWSGSSSILLNAYNPENLGSDTLTYTFTDNNGCSNSDKLILTIVTAIIPDAGIDFNICNNASPEQLFPANITGGIWNGPGTNTTGLFNPNLILPGSYTINYTINSGTTCEASDSLNVIVYPIPVVNSLSDNVCSGNPITISPQVSNGNGPYSYLWSPDFGLQTPTDEATATFIIFNSSSSSSLSSYSLSVTDSNNCSVTGAINLTVNPLPIVSAGLDTSICFAPNDPYLISGFSPNGGQWFSFPSNLGTLNGLNYLTGGVGVDTLSYTYTDLNWCSNTDTLIINVTSPIEVNAGPRITICENDPIFDLQMPLPSNPPANYTASWVGNGVVLQGGIYRFDPSLASPGLNILNYSFEFGATCAAGTQLEVFVGVPPAFSLPNIEMCTGVDTSINVAIINSTGIAPFIFEWNANPSLSSLNTQSVIYSASNNSITTLLDPLFLSVTDSIGCLGSSSSLITIHPLPQVNAGPDSTLCDQPIPFTLQNYSPTSDGIGIWSGSPNLIGDIFTPNATGTFQLSYTFTDNNGCTNSDDLNVTVVPPVFPDAGPDLHFCLSDNDFVLLPQTMQGGQWSGAGVVASGGVCIFSPTAANIGTHFITYIINSGTTCQTSDTRIFRVFPIPSVNTGNNIQVCSGSDFNLTGSVTSGTAQYQYQWTPSLGLIGSVTEASVSGNLINSTADDIFQVYYLTVNDSAGCASFDSVSVLIHPLPQVNAGPDSTLCDQPIPFTLQNYSPTSGGTGIWSGSPNLMGDVFTPNGTGTFQLTYTFTDNNGCTNSDDLNVTVVPPVFPDAGPDLQFCIYDAITSLIPVNPTEGIWNGAGIFSSNNEYFFNPALVIPSTYAAIYNINSGSTCETSDTITITVYPTPEVNAGLNRSLCIADSCLTLDGFSPSLQGSLLPPSASFFGQGAVSQSGVFCPTQNPPGDYNIYYQYLDLNTGCSNVDSLVISVYPSPIVNFLLQDTICLNSLVNIQNLSLADSIYGGNFISIWTLNDYHNSILLSDTSHNFSFTPLDTGLYFINLQLISDVGCISSTSQATYVLGLPNADFSIQEDTVCLPASISLLDNSSGYSLSYSWTVAGLYQNNNSQPLPIDFPSPVLGDTTFSIQLSLSNQCGIDNAEVLITGRPNPVSLFSIESITGCSPFMPIISNQSYGAPNSFYWDFGNGINSTEINPSSIPFIAINNDTTSYLISLVSFNECGLDTFSMPILVLPNLVNAFFNTNPPFGCANLNVNFTNFSNGATDYIWDFGDGTPLVSSTNSNHVFENGGTYLITLIATDGCGFDTATSNVTVLPKPDVSFIPTENAICKGSILDFVNTSSGAAAYLWSFGDGQQISSFEPNHQYLESGVYTVTLIGYSPIFGCPDTTTQTITVQETPEINIIINPSLGCMPLFVQFENSSQNATSYIWDFGNGNNSTEQNPSTVYNSQGEFFVTLQAINFEFTNNLSCTVDTQMVISVYPKPVSDFSLSSTNSCGDNAVVDVVNNSVGANSYLWKWNTTESLLDSPQISIVDTGITTIYLITSNQFGCKDTSSREYRLTGQPDPNFIMLPSKGCVPLTVKFTSTSIHADNWMWDFGDGNTSSGLAEVEHVFQYVGDYNVALITSNNNICFSDTLINQAVTVQKRATSLFEIDKQIISIDDPIINLTNLSFDANSFVIDFGDGQFFNQFVNQYTYSPDANDDFYSIILVADNEFNCPDTSSKLIDVIPSSGVFIPNAFTPNGDGINDSWGPVILGELKYYELLVFDRWGEQIFRSTDKDIKWDGWYKGKVVQTDVYVFRLVLQFEKDEKIINEIGRVTVYR